RRLSFRPDWKNAAVGWRGRCNWSFHRSTCCRPPEVRCTASRSARFPPTVGARNRFRSRSPLPWPVSSWETRGGGFVILVFGVLADAVTASICTRLLARGADFLLLDVRQDDPAQFDLTWSLDADGGMEGAVRYGSRQVAL